MYLRDAQDFDGTRCGEDSQIRIGNYFDMGNVGRIDKSLGCLEEKKPGDILCKEKRKEKRRLLVSYWESFIINQA